MKKLSIITVCKNDAHNLETTIGSIINQTFSNFEIIVIDGGSSDNTIEIYKKYSDRITKFLSEPDSGIFNAQNKGIKYSEGEYICFLNAGDYFTNIQILENIFYLNCSSDIIYGDINYKFSNGLIYRKKSFKSLSALKFLIESLPHPSCFIRKSVFEKIGLMDENFRITSDYEFFLRALLKYKCSTKYIPIPVAVFNLEGISSKHEHSQTAKLERKKAQETYISKRTLKLFKIFRFPILFIFKKLRYLMFLLISIINRRYTRLDTKI